MERLSEMHTEVEKMTEQVMVQKEGGKQRIPVKIQIAEQQYSKAEVKEMFERVIRRMDTLIWEK